MNKNRIPHYLIESFLAAAEEPSLLEAGERLGVTQSTLSKQMILLEQLLPHKVFAFEGRKKILTSFGQSLYDSLSPKFANIQELIEQTSTSFSAPDNVHVRICGRGELLDMVAMNLSFPGYMTFMPMDNNSALETVINRKADVAIVHSGFDSNDIVMRPLLTNSFKIAVPKSLMKTKPKNEKELTALPWLVYKAQDPVVEKLFKEWGSSAQDIKITRIYPNFTTLSKMVQKGLGVAILPSQIEVDENLAHVMPISVKSELNRKFYYCYRKDLASSGWFKDLLVQFKEMGKEHS